jgi:hypothetical protein
MATNIDIYVERLTGHENRISAVEEQQRIYAKREIVQFVVGVLAIIGSIFGAGSFLGWQNSQMNAQLITQIERRMDQLEKRIEQNERHNDARMEDLRRDSTARFDDLKLRFEDLKQVVLAQKK